MITKEQAITIVEAYLKLRNREYTTICTPEKMAYWENKKILHGKYEDQDMNVFSVNYGVMWGGEERSSFVYLNAETGEVLYSLNSHGWIEELEDE
jgi:hypothetical protein